MNLIEKLRALAASGRPDEAIMLVEGAAADGDGEAAFILANWRLWGIQGPRDLAEGHHWLDRAREAGHVEATRLKAHLLANGTGCPADFEAARKLLQSIAAADAHAARQIDMIAAMPDQLSPAEILSDEPSIQLFRGVFTQAECAYLAEMAGPALRPSLVRDPQTGLGVADPIRKSFGMYFDPSIEDLVVRSINLRLARLTGTSVSCGEMLHILRYAPGDEYRAHIDAMPGAKNQRVATALIYLNDGYKGGETCFVEQGLTVRGKAGDCLVFRNVDATGRADQRMRHAGMPVASGVKWLASRWIRERPFNPMTDE
jgi:prolyl 4-hydroxylase